MNGYNRLVKLKLDGFLCHTRFVLFSALYMTMMVMIKMSFFEKKIEPVKWKNYLKIKESFRRLSII